jgi:hypothetical protein
MQARRGAPPGRGPILNYFEANGGSGRVCKYSNCHSERSEESAFVKTNIESRSLAALGMTTPKTFDLWQTAPLPTPLSLKIK